MRMMRCVCAVVCVAAAVVCACLWGARVRRAVAFSRAALEAAPVVSAAPDFTLFPELDRVRVTALSVITPERSFQFRMDKRGAVSVNGRQADEEAFSTLLEQIAELPVERHTAFTPEAQELLLTLVVSTDTQQKTARFYGGRAEEKTRIVLDNDGAPEFRQTNGWRVGTLMMTCEGTRVQDIHGNEMPVAQ